MLFLLCIWVNLQKHAYSRCGSILEILDNKNYGRIMQIRRNEEKKVQRGTIQWVKPRIYLQIYLCP
jgi:hypothetical protein